MKLSVKLNWRFFSKAALTTCCFLGVSSSVIMAGEADVVDVSISRMSGDHYRFSVTVLHKDQGWDHYADRWDVLDESGTVLGTRVLMHPHDTEQPFTRSMSLSIPMSVKSVTVRAGDKVHGYGGKTKTVKLPN
jgi:hypothetical protein